MTQPQPTPAGQSANTAQTQSYRNSWSGANLRYQLFRRLVLPWSGARPEPGAPPPVVIGALGGSGTRLLVRILREAGFWMGAWCNPITEDAMAPRDFLQHHFTTLVRWPDAESGELNAAFAESIHAHRWGMPDRAARWGWKNPRSMWVIPFLAHHYPGMHFIQLVRDGRDMALSRNHNLLHKHGSLILHGARWQEDPIAAQLRLWVLGNRYALESGRELLGERHIVLRYEELCTRPEEPLLRLFAALGIAPTLERSAEQLIIPSPGIGRWRASDHPALQHPDDETRETLELFGYEV